jgi:DNA-binding SARP family transcriptional activator/tetratricopeptide (TPR) repeat protein
MGESRRGPVEFRVLGPVELWTAEGEHDLGSAKQRCLLAVLLLAAGRPVPTETLVERVWGTNPPKEASKSLYADISHLRKRLGAVDDRIEIRSVSHTYVLDVDLRSVDLYRSATLRDQASSLAKSSEYTEASRLLHEAKALWRAEPLAGLSGAWVEHVRETLDHDYRAMMGELVDIDFGLGRHHEMVSTLLDLTNRYPLDEEFIKRLMLAYYRCGRQIDAAHLYFATLRRLAAEGLRPYPQLEKLYQRILSHDPSLRFVRRPASGEGTPLSTLPAPLPEFVGRTAELAALTGRDGPSWDAVLITGMPGVGKTSLAVQVAHRLTGDLPDAQIYLDLHAHDAERPPLTPAATLAALLRAIGVEPTRIPRTLAERARLWRSETTGRRILVLLDDVSDREQVRPLLPTSPDCRLVLTSRSSLDGLEGVQRRRLSALLIDDAVTLFNRIAGPVGPLPVPKVAEAVRACLRLPLAVCLFATRLRDQRAPSLDALIEELRNMPAETEDGQPPELAAAFALSYRNLSEAQRRAFRQFGVGPLKELTAANVAVLIETSPAVAGNVLRELADRNLLMEVSPGRFRCHELIRRYARGCSLREDTEAHRRKAVGRVLEFYLTRSAAADRSLYPHRHRRITTRTATSADPPSEDEARRWFTDERRNLSSLVHYCAGHEWHTYAVDLANVIAEFFDTAGHWDDVKLIHQRVLRIGRDLGLPSAVAQARLNLATIQWRMGDAARAYKEARLARNIYRQIPDRANEAAALDRMGLIQWGLSDYQAALAFFDEAYGIYRDIGDTHGEANCRAHAGINMLHTGRYHEAIETFEKALEMYRSLRDRRGEANVLNNIGDAKLLLGYHREASDSYHASKAIYDSIPGRRNAAILLINFGDVARHRGETPTALNLYRQALAEFTATGDRLNKANVLNSIGFALCADERFVQALGHHRRALAIAEEIGNVYEKARAYLGGADAEAGADRHSVAMEGYRAARGLARDIDDPHLEALALRGLGDTVHCTGDPDGARICWRQAEALFWQIGNRYALSSVQIRLQALDDVHGPHRSVRLAGRTGENQIV